MKLADAAAVWGRTDFGAVLCRELERVDPARLPLVEMMAHGSLPGTTPPRFTVLGATREGERVVVRVGVFFTSIIAGCSCADDPTPVDELPEYGELSLGLDLSSGETEVATVE